MDDRAYQYENALADGKLQSLIEGLLLGTAIRKHTHLVTLGYTNMEAHERAMSEVHHAVSRAMVEAGGKFQEVSGALKELENRIPEFVIFDPKDRPYTRYVGDLDRIRRDPERIRREIGDEMFKKLYPELS